MQWSQPGLFTGFKLKQCVLKTKGKGAKESRCISCVQGVSTCLQIEKPKRHSLAPVGSCYASVLVPWATEPPGFSWEGGVAATHSCIEASLLLEALARSDSALKRSHENESIDAHSLFLLPMPLCLVLFAYSPYIRSYQLAPFIGIVRLVAASRQSKCCCQVRLLK